MNFGWTPEVTASLTPQQQEMLYQGLQKSNGKGTPAGRQFATIEEALAHIAQG